MKTIILVAIISLIIIGIAQIIIRKLKINKCMSLFENYDLEEITEKILKLSNPRFSNNQNTFIQIQFLTLASYIEKLFEADNIHYNLYYIRNAVIKYAFNNKSKINIFDIICDYYCNYENEEIDKIIDKENKDYRDYETEYLFDENTDDIINTKSSDKQINSYSLLDAIDNMYE